MVDSRSHSQALHALAHVLAAVPPSWTLPPDSPTAIILAPWEFSGAISFLVICSKLVQGSGKLVLPQKVKHSISMWPCNSPRYIPKSIESTDPNSYLYAQVQSSIIHNSHKVETTQSLSADKWINKMWHTHRIE